MGGSEMSRLRSSWPTKKHFEDLRKKYNVFYDDKGVLRCRGRLGNSKFQYETEHPIILSKQHHPALLIVRQAHELFFSTAVDFAGPLYAKTYYGLVNSKSVFWICLYTFCVTIAVSINIILDISTQTFICSMKQFCASKDLPYLFYHW